MKMKKINMDKVKEFLFDHGEKVGLGVCLFIALLVGLLGIVRARSAAVDHKSGKTWSELFSSETTRIRQAIDSQAPAPTTPGLEDSLTEGPYGWDYRDLRYQQAKYAHFTEESGGSKRDKPTVFPVSPNMNVQYWQGLVMTYELGNGTVKTLTPAADAGPGIGVRPPNSGMPGQGGPQLPFLRAAEARRMVIGSMVLPMKAQVAEFARALRMKQSELLTTSKEDLPKPMGFSLVRFEASRDGQVTPNSKAEFLIDFKNPKANARSIQAYMQVTMFDEKFAEMVEPYVWSGLTMPTPQVAQGPLPRFELPGIDVDWSLLDPKKMPGDPGPGPGVKPKGKPIFGFPKKPRDPMLMPPMGKEPENPLVDGKAEDVTKKELAKVAPTLEARLFQSKHNVFHILGELAPPPPGAVGMGGKPLFQPAPPMQGGLQPQGRYVSAWEVQIRPKDDGSDPTQPKVIPPIPMPGGMQGGPEMPDWDRDALVRFIDPDVEPGKTYVYQIQVYLANPNFKKPGKELAFDALAIDPLLPPSPWVKTGPVSIPTEYWMYAVDQQLLDDWQNPNAKSAADKIVPKDSTTFQIHQWLKKRDDFANRDEYLIGDWVVAERLVVRKGDPIGPGALVQTPVWRKLRDAFDVPSPHKEFAKDKRTIVRSGIKMDFSPPAPEGDSARAAMAPPVLVDFHGGRRVLANKDVEDTAVYALIMTADGQLMIYNSRDHIDNPDRQKRVVEVRQRIEDVRTQQPTAAAGNMFKAPGGGN